ncbi:hypothetical protein CEUSTIGMA_g8817.t1 [Chlamydomonas eustigma]|uniref:Fe2OG dioxygenase domain-containing protein n=1 Tax=Chlamydomonas eustigma TaxID=1157962 RepID=A0A250XE97_9CHLO|nr:hypothetical protein CEUSTIGMA_g8817.t1 [Chlamydomonas eustigma]|eukprot:GAX81386.1 hypothetical protein CEUSTIGMA_g8817.t1 [Chlamydomonas eustigma]
MHVQVKVRQQVWETVEQVFGLTLELYVEFTGLISWCKGSSIGWHSDDNREYLSQRYISGVLYLNNPNSPSAVESSNTLKAGVSAGNVIMQDIGFEGGDLCFQEGKPNRVTPAAGTLVTYTSDSQNIHMVEEIASGERFTLAMWFTRSQEHREDDKVQSLGCLSLSFKDDPHTHYGYNSVLLQQILRMLQLLPAGGISRAMLGMPEEMYAQDGVDIRQRRLLSHPLRLSINPSAWHVSALKQGPTEKLEDASGPPTFVAESFQQGPSNVKNCGADMTAKQKDALKRRDSCLAKESCPYGCCPLHTLTPCGRHTLLKEFNAPPDYFLSKDSPSKNGFCATDLGAEVTSHGLSLQGVSQFRSKCNEGLPQYFYLKTPDLTSACILIHIGGWLLDVTSADDLEHSDCYGCHLLCLTRRYIHSLEPQLAQLRFDSTFLGYLNF